VGRGKAVVISHNTIDRVMAHSPDAFYLLMILKRHHWGRDFILANAMAAAIGWRLSRWRSARNVLVRLGIIACIHEEIPRSTAGSSPKVYVWDYQ
jgi:hypothetical protein